MRYFRDRNDVFVQEDDHAAMKVVFCKITNVFGHWILAANDAVLAPGIGKRRILDKGRIGQAV